MTNQQKIAWLRRYGNINREIDRKLEEKARWQARAEKMSPGCDGLPGGSSGEDAMQRAIEKICIVEQEINSIVVMMIEARREIEAAIASVQDERLREVLKLHYLESKRFEKIALELNYSYVHVCRLHGWALEQVQISKDVMECYMNPC